MYRIACCTLVALATLGLLPSAVLAQCAGLVGRYYSNYSYVDTVITFDEADFVAERVDPVIDFWNAPDRYYRWSPYSLGDNYGVWWQGYLHIEVAGEYAFGTMSDDGSQLWVDGVLAVDNYEGQWWDWEDSIVEGSHTGLYPSGSGLRLLGASPNPFGASTVLRFALDRSAAVEVDIFDLAGRRVRSLARPAAGAGEQLLVWDGRDGAGEAVQAGVYLYRLRAAGQEASGKLVVLR